MALKTTNLQCLILIEPEVNVHPQVMLETGSQISQVSSVVFVTW